MPKIWLTDALTSVFAVFNSFAQTTVGRCPNTGFKMAFLLTLVVYMTWLCLFTVHPRGKNPLYDRYYPSKGEFMNYVNALPLFFAPGLLRILVSLTPPTVADLKALCSRSNQANRTRDIWAMYLVILDKRGHRSRIYVGSGTSNEGGARGRLRHYETETTLSQEVRKALEDGYKITDKCCLCWAPQPTVSLAPTFRGVFLALEAAFTFMLWAYKTKKDFYMPQMQLWSTDKFEYDGLCTHIALNEAIPGQHDLTPEEREAHAVEMAERQKELKRKAYRKRKDADPIAYNLKAKEIQRRHYHKDPARASAITKKSFAKNLEIKKYHCALCDMTFKDRPKLERHQQSQSHRELAGLPKGAAYTDKWSLSRDPVKFAATKKKSRAKAVANKNFHCALCDAAFPDNTKLNRHFKTQKHTDTVSLLEAVGVMDDVQT